MNSRCKNQVLHRNVVLAERSESHTVGCQGVSDEDIEMVNLALLGPLYNP